MPRAWDKLDLEGGGLQSMNQQLVQRMRRRGTAYALWLLFPLGAHRIYLQSRGASLLYAGLSACAVVLWLTVGNRWAMLPLAAELGLALYDLLWIDRRVPALNKALRMSLYLGTGAAPPSGYRGRYPDAGAAQAQFGDYLAEKEGERAGHQPVSGGEAARPPKRKAPSFAEQERLLRELAREKKGHAQDPD